MLRTPAVSLDGRPVAPRLGMRGRLIRKRNRAYPLPWIRFRQLDKIMAMPGPQYGGRYRVFRSPLPVCPAPQRVKLRFPSRFLPKILNWMPSVDELTSSEIPERNSQEEM